MKKSIFAVLRVNSLLAVSAVCGALTLVTIPAQAAFNAKGNVLIADQFNNRVMIVNPGLQFQYGVVNVTGNGANQLNGPYTAYVLGDYTGQTPPPATF